MTPKISHQIRIPIIMLISSVLTLNYLVKTKYKIELFYDTNSLSFNFIKL